MKRLIPLLFIYFFVKGEIVYESGNLIEFFGGTAPGSTYDNWVSHVTEGIAREDYNDYGPNWLDVQTNGFGNYKQLNPDSPILDYWESIFSSFIVGDTTIVDSLLQDSLTSFYYDLVIFEDTSLNKTFHLLREQIDSVFVDTNQIHIEDDDVIGGFRNSWGLYIINPDARREQVIIQVPHPCDDFIAPYVAMDLFLEIDAFSFMINGAGREVAWTEEGTYTNSKSLSDPSRYKHTLFQKFHEIVTEPLINIQPHWPLVFAIHSFDNASHSTRNSVILAAGASNLNTNKPIRDISEDHFDIINFTEEYPIPAGQFSNPEPLHVIHYYEANYDYEFFYDNGTEQFPVHESTSLNGIQNGYQMVHLQDLVSGLSVYEPWVQVEMDEKPMLFDNNNLSDELVYSQGIYPTNVHNFTMVRDYYQPFIQAVEQYLLHWETSTDLTPPDSIEYFMAYNMEYGNLVYLTWSPAFDTNFKTYEIQLAEDSIMYDSPIFDLSDYPSLQFMRDDEQIVSIYNDNDPWLFRIRARDYFNNIGPWSITVPNILPGHSPPDTILFFDENTEILSIYDEDIDQNDYSIDTLMTMPGLSPTLALYGNTWKVIQIEPFLPETTTILQFFAQIDSISEIQAIGFSDGEKHLRYSLAGTETLDIEKWIPVYQGSGIENVWRSYEIPIGTDWLAWYDSLSPINKIEFINDHGDTAHAPGSIHYSMILDLSPDLPIAPTVLIDYSTDDLRIENNQETISFIFTCTVIDSDSYNFKYLWEFGDGGTSENKNPTHDYVIEDDHEYAVILTVEDETGLQGWATTVIQIDDGESSFPLTMNFVGDIMMGRRFEDENGIITNQGVNALFEPTYEILGAAADITIANLEIPLSDQGAPHPTKSIVFRSSPSNVGGLIYGGIDVVSLANNHILDFMEPGMIQTQNLLDEVGIRHSGAGMNSYEAYLPAILSRKGQTIAFLASSDRTGQYNNYQPYLNAGENKPGFAYMTPYYLKQQIQSVRDFTDLLVVEMHAGSEYSYAPGSDYDFFDYPGGFSAMRINPASTVGYELDPLVGLEEEDYSPRLDRPQMWDRSIRQFAIDEGADAVIVHHPHIIQGVEVYKGKIIAHSLGNFIFDLNYPETYPSIILNAEADESGFYSYSITPLYIDDYLTVPAKGELANYILDYIAMRSRELDTYVHVDSDNHLATVIMDSTTLQIQILDYIVQLRDTKQFQFNEQAYFKSDPIPIAEAGSISEIMSGYHHITHYRLGREKIWMKNFENEGSTLWNFNSESEFIDDSVYRRGGEAAVQIRQESSSENVITNLENRVPFKNELEHTIHGFIKTHNAKDATLQLRLAESRSDESLMTVSLDDSVQEEMDWHYYWGLAPTHEDANFFDIRMSSSPPDSGQSQVWFDDVGLIEWDSLQSFTDLPISVTHPNDYNYIQIYFTQTQMGPINVQIRNDIIGDLGPLTARPKAVKTSITVPGKFHLYDESIGPVGNRNWNFIDEIGGNGRTPVFYCEEPGIYELSLTVTGPNGTEDTGYLTVVGLAEDVEQHSIGDVNGDGSLTAVDVMLCINFLLKLIELEPEEFLAADVDGNGIIEIYDALLISDLFN